MRGAMAWLNEWCGPDGDTEPYDPDAPQSWEIPDRRPARAPSSAWEEAWEQMARGRYFSLVPERNIAA